MNKLAVYVVGAMACVAFGKFIWTGEPVSGVVAFALAFLAVIGAAAWQDKDKAARKMLDSRMEETQAALDTLAGKVNQLESEMKKVHIASNIIKRGQQQ